MESNPELDGLKFAFYHKRDQKYDDVIITNYDFTWCNRYLNKRYFENDRVLKPIGNKASIQWGGLNKDDNLNSQEQKIMFDSLEHGIRNGITSNSLICGKHVFFTLASLNDHFADGDSSKYIDRLHFVSGLINSVLSSTNLINTYQFIHNLYDKLYFRHSKCILRLSDSEIYYLNKYL